MMGRWDADVVLVALDVVLDDDGGGSGDCDGDDDGDDDDGTRGQSRELSIRVDSYQAGVPGPMEFPGSCLEALAAAAL
jgi:hypothetical protein